MESVTLKIPNISCHHCVMTVRRESGMVSGVEFVNGDIEGKTATFKIADDKARKELEAALADAGYPVQS